MNSMPILCNKESDKVQRPLIQNDKLDLETILEKSTLNVNADEWYPTNPVVTVNEKSSMNVNADKSDSTNRFVCPQNPVFNSNIQDRLKRYKVKPTNFKENVGDEQINSEFSPDLNRIKDIINTLTKDPGQFHNLLEIFLETLESYIQDVMVPSIVAEIIIKQALYNPNFRYTAARLCSFVEQNSPSFREELYLRCKKLIEENCDAQNVLPLIAELCTQIPHFNVYGNLLIYAFKKILELGGNENVKWICQALKLAGYSLEQSNKVDLNQVFNKLGFLRGKVDGTADGILLESIFQLRASNWGHSTEESDSDQDDAAFDGLQNEIFCEVEGETLTAEEHEFIASHTTSNQEFDMEYFDTDEFCDPDDLYDPEPEMDEEIQEAFKEFVKIQSKH